MAMTPERRVKKKVTDLLKSYEDSVYWFYPVAGGFSTTGVPDIIVCANGLFLGVECKAGNNKLTELQQRNLEKIDKAGGVAIVVRDEPSLTALKNLIDYWLMRDTDGLPTIN